MAKFLWTQKGGFGPRPRRGHALAYDSQRKRTVLFGGDTITDGLLDDTWEWDGENWTQVTDLGPEPRFAFALAYDSQRNKTVLFGGALLEYKRLGDTWEWDGENWTQVDNGGPAPRYGHTLAFDPQRKRVVLFGGSIEGGVTADTWEWDGEGWTQTGEAGPEARTGHMLAFDPGRKALILFGGWNVEQAFKDTWTWDGETWTQVIDIGPGPIHQGALATVENRLVLFGGMLLPAPDAGKQICGDSWEWTGKRWVQRTNFGPSPRWGHAMAYDVGRRRLVLFGGLPVEETQPQEVLSARMLGDTWEHAAALVQVEEGPVGIMMEFSLNPVTATFEAIAAGNPFQIECTLRLAGPSPQPLQVTILGDMLEQPAGITVPAGLEVYRQNVPVSRNLPVGTYIIRAALQGVEKTADFRIT
jgi:hypothetical protein